MMFGSISTRTDALPYKEGNEAFMLLSIEDNGEVFRDSRCEDGATIDRRFNTRLNSLKKNAADNRFASPSYAKDCPPQIFVGSGDSMMILYARG
jgi:hypothetical protein